MDRLDGARVFRRAVEIAERGAGALPLEGRAVGYLLYRGMQLLERRRRYVLFPGFESKGSRRRVVRPQQSVQRLWVSFMKGIVEDTRKRGEKSVLLRLILRARFRFALAVLTSERTEVRGSGDSRTV